jgi:RNA polymerase sigma-70 factor (ECF subfamily)
MTYVADNGLSSESFEHDIATEPDDPEVAAQRCLNRLTRTVDDADARQIVRELLSVAAGQILSLCGSTLHQHYPRLTKGPLNVQPEELLSGVVERLIKAMRTLRPGSVRGFFALVVVHLRWELNGLARDMDAERREPMEADVIAPEQEASDGQFSPFGRRILEAIDGLPQVDRNIFDLVRVRGMTQVVAAEVLGISKRTVQRRLGRILPHLWAELGAMQPSPEATLQRNRPLGVRFMDADATAFEQSPRHAA